MGIIEVEPANIQTLNKTKNYKSGDDKSIDQRFSKSKIKNSNINILKKSQTFFKDISPSLSKSTLDNSFEVNQGNVNSNSNSKRFNHLTYMNQLSTKEFFDEIYFYQELWTKIKQDIPYLSDFYKGRISGLVTVELNLNERGELVGDFNSIDSNNDYLLTYVLASLIRTLKSPLPKEFWLKKEGTIPFQMVFDFKLNNNSNFKKSIETKFVKNSFYFLYEEYVPPLINEYTEEVFTHYVPPIIIFPGGFYMDFYHTYLFVKNFGNDSERVKRNKRNNNLKNELEKFIHQKNN